MTFYITPDKKEIEFYNILFKEIERIIEEMGLEYEYIKRYEEEGVMWWISLLDDPVEDRATRVINIVLRSGPVLSIEQSRITHGPEWATAWQITNLGIEDPEIFDKVKTMLAKKTKKEE